MVAWSSLSQDSGICPPTKARENVTFLNVPDGVPLLRSSSCDYLEPFVRPALTEAENKSSKNVMIASLGEKDSEDASNKPCGSGHPYTLTRVEWIGAVDCDVRQARIASLKAVFHENSDDEDCEEILPVRYCDHADNIEEVGNTVNVDAHTMALFQAKPMDKNDAIDADTETVQSKTKVKDCLLLFNHF